MVFKFVIRALFAALGLWLATRITPGVRVQSTETLVLAALLLGLVNAFIRPVVLVLTFPLTLITLGLFILIVNALMILLVAGFLPGFEVHGLVAGVIAAIVTGLTSWIGQMVVRDTTYRRYRED
jgi:putative membrane protein